MQRLLERHQTRELDGDIPPIVRHLNCHADFELTVLNEVLVAYLRLDIAKLNYDWFRQQLRIVPKFHV